MNALRYVGMGIVALLLLIVVLDRWNEPERALALKQSIDQLRASVEQQAQESRALRQQLEARPAERPTTTTTGHPETAPAKDANRDGDPKLGVNFLIPYDRSWFRPEWLRGTTRGFGETAKGLNMILENSSTMNDVQDRITDSLCDKWPETAQKWTESLATSVVIGDDYKTYTFTLRKGVKWQRPQIAKRAGFEWLDKDVELTAADFVFYVDMVKNPDVQCPEKRSYFDDLEKAEAIDDYTLKLTWKKKVYTSLSTSLGLSPLPRHVYSHNRDGSEISRAQLGIAFNQHWFDEERQAIGVGRFILDQNQPDKLMHFRRNPDYWGAPLHFEAMEWICDVKKPDPMLVAFKNGQVNAYSLTPSQYKSQVLDRNEPRFAAVDPANAKAGRAGEFAWERVKSNAYYYIGWNMRGKLFGDKRVRQAMSRAFPRERIIKEVYYGLGQPVESDIHPDNDYAKGLELKPFSFDLDEAKRLLAAAGWADHDGDGWLDKEIDTQLVTLRFKVKYYADSPEWDNTLLIFKNELKKIGVDMEPDPKEWKELLRVYEDRDFDGVVGAWHNGDLDLDFYQLWHSSQADEPHSSNHCGFKNARVDELAIKLRETFETPARIAITHEILSIIHEEQPYTFFRSAEGIMCWQNRGEPAKERYIDGISESLDRVHPLYDRSRVLYRMLWHFRD